MPPKAKLHKNTGKATPKLVHNDNNPQPNTSVLSPEAEQQFEIELCWCIEQLQIALNSGKLNNKQVQDHTKTLNTLMNNNAPIVKKRQVMRTSFGDYRAKMAADAKKSNITMRMKPAKPSNKSVFMKKSSFTSTGSAFRFNFDTPQDNEEEIDSTMTVPKEQCESDKSEQKNIINISFAPSDNSFRFSFHVEEES